MKWLSDSSNDDSCFYKMLYDQMILWFPKNSVCDADNNMLLENRDPATTSILLKIPKYAYLRGRRHFDDHVMKIK